MTSGAAVPELRCGGDGSVFVPCHLTPPAEMPYPEWRAWCADPTKPDVGYESMKARGLL